MITVPKYGRPPEMEYRQAVDALGETAPGDIHYLLGAGAASYAILLLVFAGFVIAPLPFALIALAYIVGMIGGWIIREISNNRFEKEVVEDAWRRYFSRRRVEFAAWNG